MRLTPALFIPLALAALPAHAEQSPPICRPPLDTAVIASLTALPLSLRTAVLENARDMVDANQPFDATDVVMHGAHFNRFAFAWNRHSRYVIATERGGIAYSNPIYVYEWNGSSSSPRLLRTTIARPSELCSQASEALSEASAPVH